MLSNILRYIGLLPKDGPVFGAKRSSAWPSVRNKHLKLHPVCEACGTAKDLDVHHIRPFHIDATLELEPSNLWTMCHKHHFEIGHNPNYWGTSKPNWYLFNIHVKSDSRMERKIS